MRVLLEGRWFLRMLGCAGMLASGVLLGQGAHRELIPAPVAIAYGSGSIDAGKLCSEPQKLSQEDGFALAALLHGLQLAPRGCSVGDLPIRLERTGDLSGLPLPGETPGPDSREAYGLTIDEHGVVVTGRSSAAIYYGVQTMLQMVERGEGGQRSVPFATVKDWPALSYRGTLMDAGSEGPMLTVEEIERQIDLIARWKGNQYFFYSEGNIALRGYPLLNRRARFTQEEIRGIVGYARDRHVDVVPAVEMYAHLHDLFRIEAYSDLADVAHGTEFNPSDARVKTMLADWASQLAELFPSRFVDIGFDETWTLGKVAVKSGSSSTPVKLFLQQLTMVNDLFQQRGKTVMAYADIMVKFPGIVPHLPKGIVALPWWYTAAPDPEYKHWLDPLVRNQVPHIVTTGVTSWDQVAPDFSVSFENIDTFLAAGRKSGSLGILNTLWTDDGQALLQMSWPGIAYGAAAGWQHDRMQPSRFFAGYARLEYPAAIADEMAAALTELNAAETTLQTAIGNETMLSVWRDPFRRASLDSTEAHGKELRQSRLHAEAALVHLYAVQDAAAETHGLESLIAGAETIDLAGMKFLYANEIDRAWKTLPRRPTRDQLMDVLSQGISNETHSRCMDMMDGVKETEATYRSAWLQQYSMYRLGTALGRWDGEYAFWLRAQTNFERLRTTFKTGERLPTLQEINSASY